MSYEIVLATNNNHKLKEVREILEPHGITVYGLKDLDLHPEDVEENGSTYEENAKIKVLSVAKLTKLPIVSDDSGLEVEAFDNKPGIHTARFASELGGHIEAMTYLINYLKDKDNRNASFHCVIALANVEDKVISFEGITEGKIANSISGVGGFGYDPVFYVNDMGMTYAEISEEDKNKVSHRARALNKLVEYLKSHQLIER